MSSARKFRITPATTRRRGLPAIGLSVFAPDRLEVTIVEGGAALRRPRPIPAASASARP